MRLPRLVLEILNFSFVSHWIWQFYVTAQKTVRCLYIPFNPDFHFKKDYPTFLKMYRNAKILDKGILCQKWYGKTYFCRFIFTVHMLLFRCVEEHSAYDEHRPHPWDHKRQSEARHRELLQLHHGRHRHCRPTDGPQDRAMEIWSVGFWIILVLEPIILHNGHSF